MSAKMDRVTPKEAERLASKLEALCRAELQREGYAVEHVRCRFGARFEFQVEALPARGSVSAPAPTTARAPPSPAEAAYLARCAEMKLPPTLVGRRFRLGGKTLVFLGLDPRRADYPLLAEDTRDGSRRGLRDTPTLRNVLRQAARSTG